MNCAQCKHNKCQTTGQDCTGIGVESVKAMYTGTDRQLMTVAACTEGRNYMKMCRLEESVAFAQELGVKKVGLAFCVGLSKEARVIVAYFAKFFEVHSVCCKVCGVSKEHLALEQIQAGRFEAMCNPKTQAKMLADAGTELNFSIGLCVGHDILFQTASTVPVSCLVTKDRILAHNPLGAVYSGYWRRKLGIADAGQDGN
ncbi:DUF1847 domain-containing protein [Sporomusa sp.]|uniref:DUF1847 domain-containing protein n=1 Tax=Sporomusa sp. TaxID=2078658 RepID=UPI002BC8C9C4|nr:DUF1847 domain-containing protein [Sporomusa sp.]HWR08020.1 DUF1847 domain-containing protein [Sporomusa sp.]